MPDPVYLDWNATAPPLPEVIEAVARAARDAWGNPSSIHGPGRRARALVEDARAEVATLAGVDPRDVVLVSGATEANNLAIRSAFAAEGPPGVLALAPVEHPSVVRVAEGLAREGRARLRWLRVDDRGAIDLADLEAALAEGGVRLVCVQAVSHETGVIQPARDAVFLAHRSGALAHVDAAQAFGRAAETGLEADTRSLAGHKLRGPKGIGALVARPGLPLAPVLLGGAQERGLRPGTLDASLGAGLAIAARHARGGPARYERLAPLRDRLEAAVLERVQGARVVGGAPRAPHATCLVLPGWSGPELVAALDLEGVAASSGSACSAGTIEPSAAVAAVVGRELASGAVRFSLGEETTDDDVQRACAAIARVVGRSIDGVD